MFLLFLYRQKLSELDEITHRLKKKLHVVTNEGFTAPFLRSICETENSFRSEAASPTVSNTTDGKSTETAAVSSANEEAYEGNLVVKITNLSQVAVGCLKLSVNKNGTEGSHVKVAEQNYEVPVHFCQECENVTTNLSQVSVGCWKLSVNKNGTDRSHVKVAERNFVVPVHFYQKCENVTQ